MIEIIDRELSLEEKNTYPCKSLQQEKSVGKDTGRSRGASGRTEGYIESVWV